MKITFGRGAAAAGTQRRPRARKGRRRRIMSGRETVG
jgi:hypothetical protein